MPTGENRVCETVSVAEQTGWQAGWDEVLALPDTHECRSAVQTQVREDAWLEWEFVHLAAVTLRGGPSGVDPVSVAD